MFDFTIEHGGSAKKAFLAGKEKQTIPSKYKRYQIIHTNIRTAQVAINELQELCLSELNIKKPKTCVGCIILHDDAYLFFFRHEG